MFGKGPLHTCSRAVLPYPIRRRMSSLRGGTASRLLITAASVSRFPAVGIPSRDTVACTFKDKGGCLTIELKTGRYHSGVRR